MKSFIWIGKFTRGIKFGISFIVSAATFSFYVTFSQFLQLKRKFFVKNQAKLKNYLLPSVYLAKYPLYFHFASTGVLLEHFCPLKHHLDSFEWRLRQKQLENHKKCTQNFKNRKNDLKSQKMQKRH